MRVHGLLVERVDLRRLGGSAGGDDIVGDNLDGCPEAPGEKEPGPLGRKGACDSAADRAASSVDHRNLVLQHHRGSFLRLDRQGRRPCRHHDVENWAPPNRPVRPAVGVDTVRSTGERASSGEGGVVTTELITRARAGDGEAFRALTEPYRRELQVHCYRMLGSFQDAEDALQDTLLAAWRGLGGFEGRASIRTWLYRIATNRCLNARRSASRRPAREWDMPEVAPPEPTRLGEVMAPALSRRPPRRGDRRAARPRGPV